MPTKKWRSKPYAVVHPRRGQKYRVAQMCATWLATGTPSVEHLADVFGVSASLIYQALRAIRSIERNNGQARPHLGNGQRPVPRRRPVEVFADDDAWTLAGALVRQHGVDTVFDRVILPAIS